MAHSLSTIERSIATLLSRELLLLSIESSSQSKKSEGFFLPTLRLSSRNRQELTDILTKVLNAAPSSGLPGFLLDECQSHIRRAAFLPQHAGTRWFERALPTNDFQLLTQPSLEFVDAILVQLISLKMCDLKALAECVTDGFRTNNTQLKSRVFYWLTFAINAGLEGDFQALQKTLPLAQISQHAFSRFQQEIYPNNTAELSSYVKMLFRFLSLVGLPDEQEKPVALESLDPLRLDRDRSPSSNISWSDDEMTVCNTSGSWTVCNTNRIITSGTHYWEVVHENGQWGSTFYGFVSVPNVEEFPIENRGIGFINYRATTQGGSERYYGEHLVPGDVVGVLVDMDTRKVWYSRNGKSMGLAFSSIAQSLCPQIAMKGDGDSLRLLSTSLSLPSVLPRHRLEAMYALFSLHRSVSQRTALPASFLRRAYPVYLGWVEGTRKRYRTRPGLLVTFDTSKSALAGFEAGQILVHKCTRYQVIGAYNGHVWFKKLESNDDQTWKQHEIWYFGNDAPIAQPSETKPIVAPLFSSGSSSSSSSSSLSASQSSPHAASSAASPPVTSSAPAASSASSSLSSTSSSSSSSSSTLDIPSSPQAAAAQATRVLSEDEFIELVNRNIEQFPVFIHRIVPKFGIEEIPTNILKSVVDSIAESLHLTDLTTLHAFFGIAIFINCEAEQCLTLLDFANPNSLPRQEEEFLINTLFFFTKMYLHFQPLLMSTKAQISAPEDEYTDPGSIVQMRLNRTLARSAPLQTDEATRFNRSLFGQAFKHIGSKDGRLFRQEYVGMLDGGQKRAFRVEFIGEGVFDNGGPYRECFTVWIEELLSRTLSLFIPCPNAQHSFGENRDWWVLNPARTSPRDFEHLQFCGKLIGCALRGGITMNFNLAPIFWKRILGIKPEPEDLEAIDTSAYRGIVSMLDVNEETFADSYEVPWTFHNSAGQELELVPGGASKYTTFSDRHTFVQMYIEGRLGESNRQIDAVIEGLKSSVPLSALRSFTWQQLEQTVCGSPDISTEELRLHTEYENVSPEEPHIYYFWEVLDELTQDQRSQFLQFCWARKRLPTSQSAWTSTFKIQLPHSSDNPDSALLSAATCFFTLSLPAYSSKEILKTRLLTSIECVTMDADIKVSSDQIAEAFSEE